MRIGRPLDMTFQKHLQNVYYAEDAVDEQDIRKMLSQFGCLSTAMHYTVPLLFVIDYTKGQYNMMTSASQLITAYDPQEFLEAGIPFLIDIYQKDDFRIYNEAVFPTNMTFLKGRPQEEHHQYIFSYNFRVRHKNGHHIPLLQRGCYITNKVTGLPMFSLGIVMDIRPFKKDRLIHHTIEKTEKVNGILANNVIASNCFFPYEEDKLLTLHERHILEHMAEGYSSKQIADRLKISENTVANHRKNMLKKTNTKNVAELVAFACRSGII